MAIRKQEYLDWMREKEIERKILTAGVEALILGMKEIDIDKVTAIVSVYKEAKEDLDEHIARYRQLAEEAED